MKNIYNFISENFFDNVVNKIPGKSLIQKFSTWRNPIEGYILYIDIIDPDTHQNMIPYSVNGHRYIPIYDYYGNNQDYEKCALKIKTNKFIKDYSVVIDFKGINNPNEISIIFFTYIASHCKDDKEIQKMLETYTYQKQWKSSGIKNVQLSSGSSKEIKFTCTGHPGFSGVMFDIIKKD